MSAPIGTGIRARSPINPTPKKPALEPTADEPLLLAIAAGDERAFADFLDRHVHKVHHFVLRMTNQTDNTDDLVQETFLRVWRNAGSFSEQRASVSTWLLSIARNLCIDHHRRETARPSGRSVADGQSVIDATLASAVMDAPLQLDKSRRLNLLKSAIADLPERQRTAVTLCLLQGHSNAYAAELLNIKVAAVESLLARGRRALRTALTTEVEVESQ